MFAFLDPYMAAIKIGAIAFGAVAILSTLGYVYYEWNHMKDTIKTQEANITLLDTKIKADDAVITDLKKNQKIAQDLTGQYMAALQASQQQLLNLSDKLRKLNIPNTITVDPSKTETDINGVFNSMLNCLSSSTGSTEKCAKQ